MTPRLKILLASALGGMAAFALCRIDSPPESKAVSLPAQMSGMNTLNIGTADTVNNYQSAVGILPAETRAQFVPKVLAGIKDLKR